MQYYFYMLIVWILTESSNLMGSVRYIGSGTLFKKIKLSYYRAVVELSIDARLSVFFSLKDFGR